MSDMELDKLEPLEKKEDDVDVKDIPTMEQENSSAFVPQKLLKDNVDNVTFDTHNANITNINNTKTLEQEQQTPRNKSLETLQGIYNEYHALDTTPSPIGVYDVDTNREFSVNTVNPIKINYLKDLNLLNKDTSNYFAMRPVKQKTSDALNINFLSIKNVTKEPSVMRGILEGTVKGAPHIAASFLKGVNDFSREVPPMLFQKIDETREQKELMDKYGITAQSKTFDETSLDFDDKGLLDDGIEYVQKDGDNKKKQEYLAAKEIMNSRHATQNKILLKTLSDYSNVTRLKISGGLLDDASNVITEALNKAVEYTSIDEDDNNVAYQLSSVLAQVGLGYLIKSPVAITSLYSASNFIDVQKQINEYGDDEAKSNWMSLALTDTIIQQSIEVGGDLMTDAIASLPVFNKVFNYLGSKISPRNKRIIQKAAGEALEENVQNLASYGMARAGGYEKEKEWSEIIKDSAIDALWGGIGGAFGGGIDQIINARKYDLMDKYGMSEEEAIDTIINENKIINENDTLTDFTNVIRNAIEQNNYEELENINRQEVIKAFSEKQNKVLEAQIEKIKTQAIGNGVNEEQAKYNGLVLKQLYMVMSSHYGETFESLIEAFPLDIASDGKGGATIVEGKVAQTQDNKALNQNIIEKEKQRKKNKKYYKQYKNATLTNGNDKFTITKNRHFVDGNQWTQRTAEGQEKRQEVLENLKNIFASAKRTGESQKLEEQKIGLLQDLSKSKRFSPTTTNNSKLVGKELKSKNDLQSDDNTNKNNSQDTLEKKLKKIDDKLKRGVVNYEYYTKNLDKKHKVRFDVEVMKDGTKQIYNFNIIEKATGKVFNQSNNINKDTITTKEQQERNKPLYDNLKTKQLKNNKNIGISENTLEHLADGNKWENRTEEGLKVRHQIINNLDNILDKSKHNKDSKTISEEIQELKNKRGKIKEGQNLIDPLGATNGSYDNNNTNKNNSQESLEEINKKIRKLENKIKRGVVSYSYYTGRFKVDGKNYKVIFDVENDNNGNKTLYNFSVKDSNNKVFNQNNEQQESKSNRANIVIDENNNSIINIFQQDASNLVHEFAHYFSNVVSTLSENGNIFAQEDLKKIENFKNQIDGNAREKEEYFARSFEAYLLNGKTRHKSIKGVFRRMKEFMMEVYNSLKDLNVNFTQDTQNFFDDLLTIDAHRQRLTTLKGAGVEVIGAEINNTNKQYKKELERARKKYNQSMKELEQQNVIDLTNEFKYLQGKSEQEIKEEITNLLNELKGNDFTTKDNNNISIDDRGIDHIEHKREKLDATKTKRIRNNVAISKLEQMINNSVLVETRKVDNESVEHNTYKTREWKLKNLQSISIFETPIKINDKVYYVNLIGENYKKGNLENKPTNKSYLYEVFLKNEKNTYEIHNDIGVDKNIITSINNNVNRSNEKQPTNNYLYSEEEIMANRTEEKQKELKKEINRINNLYKIKMEELIELFPDSDVKTAVRMRWETEKNKVAQGAYWMKVGFARQHKLDKEMQETRDNMRDLLYENKALKDEIAKSEDEKVQAFNELDKEQQEEINKIMHNHNLEVARLENKINENEVIIKELENNKQEKNTTKTKSDVFEGPQPHNTIEQEQKEIDKLLIANRRLRDKLADVKKFTRKSIEGLLEDRRNKRFEKRYNATPQNRLTPEQRRIKDFTPYLNAYKDFNNVGDPWYKRTFNWIKDGVKETEAVITDIDKKTGYKIKKWNAETSRLIGKKLKQHEGFFDGMEKMKKKNIEDYKRFDISLKNRDIEMIKELAKKYGFLDDYLNLKKDLNNLRQEAIDAGVDVGYIEDYFPRQLKLESGQEILQLLQDKDPDTYNDIMHNLGIAKRAGKVFSEADELRFINNHLRGFTSREVMALVANKNLRKPREAETITPEMLKFYEYSDKALESYLINTVTDIQKRKFFGIEDQDTRERRNILLTRRKQRDKWEAKLALKEQQDAKLQREIREREEGKSFSQDEKDGIDRPELNPSYKNANTNSYKNNNINNNNSQDIISIKTNKEQQLTKAGNIKTLRKLINKPITTETGQKVVVKDENIRTINNGQEGHINRIKHIVQGSKSHSLNTEQQKVRDAVVNNINEVIKHSTFTGEKNNKKKDTKPDIEKYGYFVANVEVDGNKYKVVIDTDVKKAINQAELNPQIQDANSFSEKNYKTNLNNSQDVYTIYDINIFDRSNNVSKTFYQDESSNNNDIPSIDKFDSEYENVEINQIAKGKIQENLYKINKDIEELEQSLAESDVLEMSIGNFIKKIDNLKVKDAFLLNRALIAIFNHDKTGDFSRFVNSTSTALAVNSFRQAGNQLGEMFSSMIHNGPINTIKGWINGKVKLQELGLDNNAVKLMKNDFYSNMGKYTNWILKWTGFDGLDKFGKHTFINGSIERLQNEVKANNKTLNEELDLIFGKEGTEQFKKDVTAGNITNDVKDYIFIKLSEIQPLSMSQKSLTYLESGKTRWVYSLASYTYKQANRLMGSVTYDFTHGQKLQGMQKLIALEATLTAFPFLVDVFKLLFLDDDENEGDTVTDTIMNLYLSNSFVLGLGKQFYRTAEYDNAPVAVQAIKNLIWDIIQLKDWIEEGSYDSFWGALGNALKESNLTNFIPTAKDIKWTIKHFYKD
jgi:hypothetical protein